jgi:hypothetical protein
LPLDAGPLGGRKTVMEALGNIGDFLGGIGVVITLIYLAGQIRQNTRSIRTSATSSSLFPRRIAGITQLS